MENDDKGVFSNLVQSQQKRLGDQNREPNECFNLECRDNLNDKLQKCEDKVTKMKYEYEEQNNYGGNNNLEFSFNFKKMREHPQGCDYLEIKKPPTPPKEKPKGQYQSFCSIFVKDSNEDNLELVSRKKKSFLNLNYNMCKTIKEESNEAGFYFFFPYINVSKGS